jgi:hypothetical protein
MKNLYRRYKISKLLDEPLLDKEKEIVEFVLDKIKDLNIFSNGSNIHYYRNSKGEKIFEREEFIDYELRLWITNEGFWKVLEKKYLLSTWDIQYILYDIICENYKINIENLYNIRSLYF